MNGRVVLLSLYHATLLAEGEPSAIQLFYKAHLGDHPSSPFAQQAT